MIPPEGVVMLKALGYTVLTLVLLLAVAVAGRLA